MSLEPARLMDYLELEAKGFQSPTSIHYSRLDGKEARLIIKAIYHGPRPGWPLLERKTIFDLAQRSKEQDLKAIRDESDYPQALPSALCLADGKPSYPINVTIRIALTSQLGACDDMLKAIRTYAQLCTSDYRPFELPVATWRTAEGLWNVVLDEGAVVLSGWWERNVQPRLHASESRWKIGSWRQKGEDWDGQVGVTQAMKATGDKQEKEAPGTQKRTRFVDDVLTPNSPVSAQQQDTPENERTETSQSEKQEWAAILQQQTLDRRRASYEALAGNSSGVPMPSTAGKQIGVDEEEEEAMSIDKGWLPAVNVLIQLADIIRLTHFSAIAPMSGFEGGKIVGHVTSDFDGDRMVVLGPASPSFASVGEQAEEEGWLVGEDEGLGALKGVLDEASILRHLQYIAPEAISSKKAIASTIDIFSWGMAAYELLKGKGQEGTESDSEVPEFFRAIHIHSTRAIPTMTTLCPSMPSELSAIIEKALALDPEQRYNSCCALLHDLYKVKQICEGNLRGQARGEFIVGYVDQQSRFRIPPGLLDREQEFATLDEAYRQVKSTGRSQVACCWGTSGSGKSKLLELWARQKEAENAGQDCFVGWAKMDQHLVKPLSAFIPVFCSLLERVFSDPLESAADWRQRILDSLAVNANIFLALLPKEWQAILLDGKEPGAVFPDATAGIDWESWVKQFRTWSYGLLGLFASESRPLVSSWPFAACTHTRVAHFNLALTLSQIIVIDDLQWMEKSERELWEELIASETRRLDHCVILFSFRTHDEADLSLFNARYMIKANPFDETTVSNMVYKSFHLDSVSDHLPDTWMQLCNYLYTNTKGNPFDLRWALTTLVHDGDIYYDYVRQEWHIEGALRKASLERNSEDFAASVLNNLGEQAKTILCYLACLPSRGVDISLLSRLTGKREGAVYPILENCVTMGIVSIGSDKVRFVHDKPHSAALAMIDAQDKPNLLLKIGRGLEGMSADFEYIIADMLLNAADSKPDGLEPVEIARATVKAARQAAKSAALDLAASYLERIDSVWSFTVREAWRQEPELAMAYVTVTAEVALGRRAATLSIPKVSSIKSRIPVNLPTSIPWQIAVAYELAAAISVKLDIAVWLFKLQISAGNPDLAMQSFFSALRVVGYESPAERQRYPPLFSNGDDIRAIAKAPEPTYANEARLAISLAYLVGIAGPTFYAYEADKGWRIMHFAIPIYLHNHSAAKHPSVAYSWYIMAVLLAERGAEFLNLVRAYMDLGATYDLAGNPLEGYAETAKPVLAYITQTRLSSADYSRSYEVCYVTQNYDLLSYVLGLDLSSRALSSESALALFSTGREVLSKCGDDLQPATRLLTAPWIQFGANLIDSTLLGSKCDLTSLNVLEGEYVSAQDAKSLASQTSLYTAVYAQASLMLGLLFKAKPDDLRQRAELLRDNRNGGAGTILGVFSAILLSLTSLTLDDPTDVAHLKHSHAWLNALSHNQDFQAISEMLFALEKIKAVRQGEIPWQEMLGKLEDALADLEAVKSHLFTGFLCTHAEASMPLLKGTVRHKRGYLQHAQLAFQAAGALNLVRSTEILLSALPPSTLLFNADGKSVGRSTSVMTSSEDLLSRDVASSLDGSDEITNINGKELHPRNQKLGLESILRSFLVLASERDSDGLIRRVLRVLLQITCSNYACFAAQDPATGSMMLKGYGAYEDIAISDVAMSQATDIAPTVLISHASITKKVIRYANGPTSSNANLIRREPFFALTGPPKTLLALPLFVQGRFSGLLFLSGNVANAQVSTSQVGLLATFASILLESHSAYNSLESAVETRTQQLQHALHSRSTFISGVSHEIRTPLFAINGLCAVMGASADLTDTQRENLQVISQSADDLQRIVTDVLDWSKLDAQSITPESIPFDLRNVIENALETVAHLARSKNITLLLENPVSTDPQSPLLGDPHRYRQCLLNLLSNAIKFTTPAIRDQASTVSISWSWQDRGDKVEITCAIKDEGIVDKGKVPGAEQQQTFPSGPSRRAVLYAPKNVASAVIQANLQHFGITTTLSAIENPTVMTEPDLVLIDVDEPTINYEVVQALRKRHQGSKFVESLALNQEAIVTKPLKAQSLYNTTRNLVATDEIDRPKATRKTLTMDSSYAKQYPLKICFIDDSNVNVAVGRKILSKFGYKDIDVCYDGLQAVEAAERTTYDLMLMDLQPTKDRCLKDGFADFLTKPLIISDLAKLLVRVYTERYGTTTAPALAEV
ncbi:hypothetical protein QFC21_005910 [Naganishia friedmannii]|uniref:Uncharacterized protein n=1 Tax=Naganishia friedmannii TaxID=89922 RepID=A0ACC2V756_9TREE|nr:hypothetical protein QFC21_005910 [Naganishia friedmannii]